MKAIEIKNLNKSYKDFSLKNINLSIPKGMIVGIIGENGAGKTTLIYSILNIIKVDSGDIEIFNVNNKSEEFTKIKERIGVVLDSLGLYEGYDIFYINKLFKLAYKNWDSENFYELLKKFDVYSDKKIKNYSAGMKKRLNIVLSLVHNPDLLILDEPTVNLDPVARDEILKFILDYTRDEEKTILISSHILSVLEKICDYICYIHDGEIVLFEEKDLLMEKYSLLKIKKTDLVKIQQKAILSLEESPYGYEVLIETKYLPPDLDRQFTTLEEVIVKLIRSKKNESINI